MEIMVFLCALELSGSATFFAWKEKRHRSPEGASSA
jgi:hypothetical protein